MMDYLHIVECPRDAMQGLDHLVPTADKIRYLNALLKVGYHTLDFGSFVSERDIPQFKDIHQIMDQMDLGHSQTRLLAIVANERGASDAMQYDSIADLGYPFSISEVFQERNTRKSIQASFRLVESLLDRTVAGNKNLVVYLSMGFGNPYGETWNEDLVFHWCEELIHLGVQTISISDTIGVGTPDHIQSVFATMTKAYPDVTWGGHFHTHAHNWREKVDAAFNGGCRRLDGAIRGYGGCPLSGDDLLGNMPTEKLITFAAEKKLQTGINPLAFESAYNIALNIF
jgi:hydroxymethylglutaryl-CoA lyase